MNKHKESLEKILSQSNDSDSRAIALTTLNSQDRMYSEEEVIGEIQFPFDDKKSYPEDFSHENGQYQNRCFLCTHYFLGHKRRVMCKECFTKTESVEPKEQPTSLFIEKEADTPTDRQINAIRTVFSKIKTKEDAIKFLIDAGIELEEADTESEKTLTEHWGIKKEVDTKSEVKCHSCNGTGDINYFVTGISGSEDDSYPCTRCNGTGREQPNTEAIRDSRETDKIKIPYKKIVTKEQPNTVEKMAEEFSSMQSKDEHDQYYVELGFIEGYNKSLNELEKDIQEYDLNQGTDKLMVQILNRIQQLKNK